MTPINMLELGSALDTLKTQAGHVSQIFSLAACKDQTLPAVATEQVCNSGLIQAGFSLFMIPIQSTVYLWLNLLSCFVLSVNCPSSLTCQTNLGSAVECRQL